jgi:tRNA A-37 threonylcarbamoyl transferase component Bud32
MITVTKTIEKNLDIVILMSSHNISPKILDINQNGEKTKITIEKYSGDLEYLARFYTVFPQDLKDKIIDLIDRMHKLDICHGNLNAHNIVFKPVDGETIIFHIINFEYSFHISTGENDKQVTKFRTENFDDLFDNTYEGYVKYDYLNWQQYITNDNLV